MLEIPETTVIAGQAENLLSGKIITKVINASSPHSFTWYNGDPVTYSKILEGRTVESAEGHGSFITLHCDSDTHLTIGDGTHMTYYQSFQKHPVKHQLLLVFEDDSFLTFTVSMYGAIYAYKGKFENPYYKGSLEKRSPLEDSFDENYFESLLKGIIKDISVKALLATEQRIPGLGNGVLQDILFNAEVNPRKKISEITEREKKDLFHCLKVTLKSMTEKGGRDTEKDFYGNRGGYKTLLSKNTYKDPCPNCGGVIVKEAFLGGTIYYCSVCQPLPAKKAKK